jgi:hypothetical protein
MALVKYNNNSISAITSTAGMPAGAMTLIKNITASSDSTINFVDGASDVVLDNTYPIYLFKFINIHPSSDSNRFLFQGSTNTGSGYGVNITSTFFKAFHAEADNSNGVSYDTQNDLAQSTSFQQLNLDADLGADNDQGLSGELYLFSPSSTTFVKHFMGTSNFNHAGDYTVECFYAGYFNTTSAIDAIQFKMNDNEIDSGSIKLYGIKDS